MTEYYNHHTATFECVDRNAESVPGSQANDDGSLFLSTEASCNGLPMIPRKSSPVQCAQSDVVTCCTH